MVCLRTTVDETAQLRRHRSPSPQRYRRFQTAYSRSARETLPVEDMRRCPSCSGYSPFSALSAAEKHAMRMRVSCLWSRARQFRQSSWRRYRHARVKMNPTLGLPLGFRGLCPGQVCRAGLVPRIAALSHAHIRHCSAQRKCRVEQRELHYLFPFITVSKVSFP